MSLGVPLRPLAWSTLLGLMETPEWVSECQSAWDIGGQVGGGGDGGVQKVGEQPHLRDIGMWVGRQSQHTRPRERTMKGSLGGVMRVPRKEWAPWGRRELPSLLCVSRSHTFQKTWHSSRKEGT